MDKYDEDIAYLTEHPEEIQDAWGNACTHDHGSLFMWIGETTASGGLCGCLTQIRHEGMQACTKELTKLIRADDRIPKNEDVAPDNFYVFAEWQRRVDAMGVR